MAKSRGTPRAGIRLFALKMLLLSLGWQGFKNRVDISSRSLTIDGKLVIAVDAYDQQLEVRFADQSQDRLKDESLDKLFFDCQPMMLKRRVRKICNLASSV